MKEPVITTVAGAGGKGGGSQPYQAPDSLFSQQQASVELLFSEGPIGGPVDGWRGVTLNGTPLQKPDGSNNFKDVWFEWRPGTQWQTPILYPDQTPWENEEFAVGTRVYAGDGSPGAGTPWIGTLSSPNVDHVDVTIEIPALYFSNDKGDTRETSVAVRISKKRVSESSWTECAFVENPVAGQRTDFNHVLETEDAAYAAMYFDIATPNGADLGVPPEITVYSKQAADTEWEAQAIIPSTWTDATHTAATAFYRTDIAAPGTWQFKATASGGQDVLIQNGSVQKVGQDVVFTGKCTNPYRKSIPLGLQRVGEPWQIMVERATVDSTDPKLQNETWVSSFTESTFVSLIYPNVAHAVLSVDAKMFPSIPECLVKLWGIECFIPDNYQPNQKHYVGTWGGDWARAYTNCPAWVWVETSSNPRWGGGLDVDSQIDKWQAYELGKWCDQNVPDGRGGLEPRFQIALYLNDPGDAFAVMSRIAQVFQTVLYYGGGQLHLGGDRATDPVWLFTNANVIDGLFHYSGAKLENRHSCVRVQWNDPNNFSKPVVLAVLDNVALARYGFRELDLTGVGAITPGQAIRLGRAVLASERLEDEIVKFQVALEGLAIAPQDVVAIADNDRAGRMIGGRFVETGTTTVKLDRPVDLANGPWTLRCIKPNFDMESVDLHAPINSAHNPVMESAIVEADILTDTLTVDLPHEPLPGSAWQIWSTRLAPTLWRIIRIREIDLFTMEIEAVKHNPEKYDEIDNGLHPYFDGSKAISVIDPLKFRAPRYLTAAEELYLEYTKVKTRVTLTWEDVPGAARYLIRYQMNGGAWSTRHESMDHEIMFPDMDAGLYHFEVRAVSPWNGKQGPAANLTQEILGKTAKPPDVTNFSVRAMPDGTRVATFGADNEPLDVTYGGGYVIRYKRLS